MEQEEPTSVIGPGRFQWNTIAWFGSAVGGSAFMAILAGFLLAHGDSIASLVPMAAFTLIIVVSFLLWLNRHRICPFPAIMWLVGVFAIAVPVVVISVDQMAQPGTLMAMNWPISFAPKVIMCLIAPYTMLKFYTEERRFLRQRLHNGKRGITM